MSKSIYVLVLQTALEAVSEKNGGDRQIFVGRKSLAGSNIMYVHMHWYVIYASISYVKSKIDELVSVDYNLDSTANV